MYRQAPDKWEKTESLATRRTQHKAPDNWEKIIEGLAAWRKQHKDWGSNMQSDKQTGLKAKPACNRNAIHWARDTLAAETLPTCAVPK